MKWLGFDWNEHLYFTSDYFERLFDFAVDLIEQGKAFVDDQSAEEIRASLLGALDGRLKLVGLDVEQIDGDFDLLGSGVLDSVGNSISGASPTTDSASSRIRRPENGWPG